LGIQFIPLLGELTLSHSAVEQEVEQEICQLAEHALIRRPLNMKFGDDKIGWKCVFW
jgi:hypothetical protein